MDYKILSGLHDDVRNLKLKRQRMIEMRESESRALGQYLAQRQIVNCEYEIARVEREINDLLSESGS